MFRLALKSQFLLFILIMGFGQFSVAAKKQQVSLEEASELIRHSTQGKVLSARTTGKDNLKSHRIQVLTPSGRIKVYQVPANNSQKNKNENYDRRDNRQSSNYLVNPKQRDNSRSSQNRTSNSSNNRNNSNTNNSQKNQTRTSTSKQSKGESKQK